jgi:hypothetical protein
MGAKQAGIIIFSLLWLTACAATGPAGTAESTDTITTDCRKETSRLADTTETTPIASTATTHNTGEIKVTRAADEIEVLTLPQLLYRLDRAATLDPDEKKERIQLMKARLAQLGPADKYEYALLLSHNGSNNKVLNRIISILDGLEEYVKDQIVQEIILLHRRYFALLKQYSAEHSKTIELNKKIERLKGLEQDLDKSNTRMQESLNPTPGKAQQP